MTPNALEAAVAEVCRWLTAWIPHPSFQYAFMQQAMVGLLLVAPLCAAIGIQVVNFRMAFFSEAIGHSAFTGIALGFLASSLIGLHDPKIAMIGFGLVVSLMITLYRRRSGLSSDTIIGVFSATVVALGLCIITHLRGEGLTGNAVESAFESFLLGNILLVTTADLFALFCFFCFASVLQYLTYNRMLFIGLNSDLAHTMGINVAAYEYGFAALVGLVVMFSIQWVGVLLVTAMLVIPAAAARNFTRSAGAVFWWSLFIATSSAVSGLFLSVIYNLGTGGAIVLTAAAWFLISGLYVRLAGL